MTTAPERNPDFRPALNVDGLKGMNTAQRLYVLPAGSGVSCLGFDVAYERTKQAAEILNRPDLMPPRRRGTPRAFRAYKTSLAALMEYGRRNPDWLNFEPNTPDEVRRVLTDAMRSGQRVRIFCGEPDTGEAWAEEWGTVGYVGRTTGPLRSPLLVANSRSVGGDLIMTSRVVGIMGQGGAWLYRHPKLNLGAWTVEPSDLAGYPFSVKRDGETHANMKTEAKAERLRAFMAGERFAR